MENTMYLYSDEYVYDPGYCTEAACVTTVIFNVIIFLLGITGNAAVIWITGFKMKKSVNSTWYLSLALSDFIFCATLPFTFDYMVKQSWNLGLFMCKFHNFVVDLSIYSNIFILVIISVDRCITVKFPAWAQNQRTVKKASIVVVLAWIVSSFLSISPAIFRETINRGSIGMCYIDYENYKIITLLHFTIGFLIPFLIIFICYFILICELRANQTFKFTKPYRIMTLLMTAFFICWLPFQIVSILDLDTSNYTFSLYIALLVCTVLTHAKSFLNPFIYALMGKNLNKKCYSFLSRIESAINEGSQSAVRATSNTDSVDERLSAAV